MLLEQMFSRVFIGPPIEPSKRATVYIAWSALFLFLLFLGVYGAQKAVHPEKLTTIDDPYFHVRYSALLAEGVESPPLPYVSSMSWWGGGTLYYGYHTILSTAFTLTGATNSDEQLIAVSKIFHAVLAAIVMSFIFWVMARVLCNAFPHVDPRRTVGIAVLFTLLIPLLFPIFATRLSLERPFILSILFFMSLIHALLERRPVWLFFTSALFPLFYSFAILAFIPVVIYAYVYARLLGIHSWRTYVMPTCVAGAGILLGTLLHPNPIHYVFNGYIVHLLALYNVVRGTVPEGAEILPPQFTIIDYMWMSGVSLLFIVMTVLWQEKRSSKQIDNPLYFMGVLTLALVPLQIVFQRMIEYFAPIATVTIALTILYVYESQKTVVEKLIAKLTHAQLLLLRGVSVMCVGLGVATAYISIMTWSDTTSIRGETSMYDTVRRYAQPGDRVITANFHSFTVGYFFMPELVYNQGMGTTFSLVADPSMYWLFHHTIRAEDKICSIKKCAQSEMDTYQVIHDVYKARFVIIDYPTDPTLHQKSLQDFIAILSNDSRFTLIHDENWQDHRFAVFLVPDAVSVSQNVTIRGS